ncbi:hypothetical protein MHU86_4810 [Fragilaria crotonensis]|nr:hypothetical protein MHU86_4810 [Fragilaria crotonensis]
MRASTYDNQGYENDRNPLSVGLRVEDVVEDVSISSALHDGHPSPPPVQNGLTTRCSPSGLAFNLRKRSFSGDDPVVGLSTYNSDFLSGLFADIAKANVVDEGLPVHNAPSPSKKSRVSMTQSISRCEKSFANLHVVAHSIAGSKGYYKAPGTESVNLPLTRDDSLSYQLHCVSSASSNESESCRVADSGMVAFPHLPATISNSSCDHLARLTRRNTGQLLPDSETDPKESYGWFVNFDDDDSHFPPLSRATAIPFSSPSSLNDLTFSAVTAPKGSSHHDAEVEWAKAADTVDDVLGDFF